MEPQTNNKFPEIRRQNRILEDLRAIELLETSLYGFLCLGENENGYTYGIPISYAYDEARNCLHFHCATEGQKLEILKHQNKVSFCVVKNVQTISHKFSTLYESVIVFGTADMDPCDEDKRTALRELVKKYSPDYLESGETYIENAFHKVHTFKITIEHITAKGNK